MYSLQLKGLRPLSILTFINNICIPGDTEVIYIYIYI